MDALRKALGLGHLHQAVFAGDLKKIKELLRHGEDPNKQTAVNKMTALHIAVIVRKYRIACLLIRMGASLSVQDQNGRTPAKYNYRKLRSRYLALFKRFGYRHEDNVGRESAKLSKLLRYPVAMRSVLSGGERPLSNTVIHLDGKNLVILKKVLHIPLPASADDSTYGYIAGPNDSIPNVAAISGWAYGDTVLSSGWLPNAKFTEFVRDAANFLGFSLPEQGFLDSGPSYNAADSGRHLASHVEKQLGLAWALRLLRKYCKTSKVESLKELRDVQLKKHEANAWIFLNHDPCANCLGFLTRLEETTGVSFTVKSVPTVVKRERQSKRGENSTTKQPVSQAVAVPQQDTSLEDDNVTRDELAAMPSGLPQTPPRRSKFKSARDPIAYTSPPVPWTRYDDGTAKPLPNKIGMAKYQIATSSDILPESSQPASQASEVIPLSTITTAAGTNRSAFFQSPEPPKTRNGSKTKLDLGHFKYRRTPAPTSPIVKKPNRGCPRGSKNKQPSRSTVRKQATMREKSTFANAVRFYQKQRQLSRSNSH
ncbi:hypothetical protein V8F33_005389 [Rhypophila sp. PSN 637]